MFNRMILTYIIEINIIYNMRYFYVKIILLINRRIELYYIYIINFKILLSFYRMLNTYNKKNHIPLIYQTLK